LSAKSVVVGYSPCPNDTFLFYALVHGRVDTEGYRFEPVLADVETLNRWALTGRLPMTKASFGVLGQVCSKYWCLRSGGALSWGRGPLLVARGDCGVEALAGKRVAVPGLHTTANLLLEHRVGSEIERVPMPFHEIIPAVARGGVDAGVVIHEGRFTYAQHGLVAIEDLGAWWERETELPIPLGCILLAREPVGLDPWIIQRVLRRSVEYAQANPDEPAAYVRAHARELDDRVIRQHIDLYVNHFSVDLGESGQRAVEELLRRSSERETCAAPLFPAGDG